MIMKASTLHVVGQNDLAMGNQYKDMIHNYLYEGDDDKEMKKLAALMVEAMIKELDRGYTNTNKKYCIPCASEVTAIIGKMSASRNNPSK